MKYNFILNDEEFELIQIALTKMGIKDNDYFKGNKERFKKTYELKDYLFEEKCVQDKLLKEKKDPYNISSEDSILVHKDRQ